MTAQPSGTDQAPPEGHQPGPSLRAGRVFTALAVPNFRLYFAGQAVSLVGTWMQVVAQSWLVLQLTGSGALLGLVAAAQFLPVLLLGPYGGLVADRADKRRLLLRPAVRPGPGRGCLRGRQRHRRGRGRAHARCRPACPAAS